jgi:hypothetical protein
VAKIITVPDDFGFLYFRAIAGEAASGKNQFLKAKKPINRVALGQG